MQTNYVCVLSRRPTLCQPIGIIHHGINYYHIDLPRSLKLTNSTLAIPATHHPIHTLASSFGHAYTFYHLFIPYLPSLLPFECLIHIYYLQHSTVRFGPPTLFLPAFSLHTYRILLKQEILFILTSRLPLFVKFTFRKVILYFFC